jgi:hypothetical protein
MELYILIYNTYTGLKLASLVFFNEITFHRIKPLELSRGFIAEGRDNRSLLF